MKFRTELTVLPSAYKISLQDNLVSIGSCFANTLGTQLEADKFSILNNPLGILYHPLSIWQYIFETTADADCICHDEIWYHYQFHSQVCASSKTQLLSQIEELKTQLKTTLKTAKVLVITLGTAWVYLLKDRQKIVANCHKIPSQYFEKKLLTVEEITASFEQFYNQLLTFNSSIKIIFTLSPVRHIKDTLELNNVSKSILRLAIYQLQKKFSELQYFPAYELLIDDLRDYRFYASDMLHPSKDAEQYIIQKFYDAYISSNEITTINIVRNIANGLQHKPFNSSTTKHQTFLNTLLTQANSIAHLVDMKAEINAIQCQLLPPLRQENI